MEDAGCIQSDAEPIQAVLKTDPFATNHSFSLVTVDSISNTLNLKPD